MLPPPPPQQTKPPALRPDTRPSWPAVAAGLLALVTFFAVTGGSWITVGLVAGLLAARFSPLRLETESPLRWLIRIALIGLIVFANQGEANNPDYLIGQANFRAAVGQLYGLEMVIQAWRRRADPGHVSLAVVLFSGLVFLTACNTFEDRLIWLVTPAYLVCVALALRGHRARSIGPDGGDGAPASPSDAAALRRARAIARGMAAAGVALSIGLGFSGYRAVRAYRGELNELGNRILLDRRWLESTGMSAQPQLGSTFDLRGSPARVLRVAGLGGDAHLRGMAFDNYQFGGRWGPAVGQREFKKVTLNDLTAPPSVNASLRNRSDVVITRLVSDNRLLYAPLGAAAIDPGEAEDAEWAEGQGGPIRTRTAPPYEYRVTVGNDERFQGPLAAPRVPASGALRSAFLTLPDDPQGSTDMAFVRGLARRITAGARGPEEKAERIAAYLISNHEYSLSTQAGPGDPVASFLREKKSAHCEYFAASAALLLRAAGVPSRYVQGYLAHETEAEGTVIVRQRDAHAWTEYWIDGKGWAWVDATPGDGRPDHDPEGIPLWRRATEWLQDRLQGIRDVLADLPPEVLNTLVAAVAVLPLVYYALRTLLARRRGKAAVALPPVEYTGAPPDLETLAARFEAALARAGAPVPPERTWQEHLSALANPDPAAPLAEVGAQFARAYDAARFGGRTDAETLTGLARLLSEIEREAPPASKAGPNTP